MNRTPFRIFLPALYALLFLIFLLTVSYYYASYRRGLWEKDIRNSLLETLVMKKSRIEKALSSRVYYTKGIAAFVSIQPDITDREFYNLAQQLVQNDPVISTMSLSRDGIINAIYPLAGHEAAIGLNLMAHPKRKEVVEKTIRTRKTFIAGPVELIEGGVAFISYTPIFTKNTDSSERFWGMTDIVIKKDELFEDAGLVDTENNFEFAMRGMDGTGENGAVFFGDSAVFDQTPVEIKINLPDGNWILAATPLKGWTHFFDQDKTLDYIMIISAFIISILFWLLLRTQFKVNANEKELKAVFRSMQNLIIEFSDEGEYIRIPETNKELLYKEEKQLLGKRVTEIFDSEMADLFMSAIKRCLALKDLVEIEYPLDISGKKHWFSARISYKSPHRVIMNAYDITDRKENEQNLRKSEQRMKELNDVKDKFFSIIAHDLRSPVGSFKMLTEIMLNEVECADQKKNKRMLTSIHSASSNLYDLLENLLSWSHTQRNSLIINKEEHNLFHLADDAIDSHIVNAEIKNVALINEVKEDARIVCDQYVTLTIIRNLVSNALKFTPTKGKIVVSNQTIEKDGIRYQGVTVTDTGVGIAADRLGTIFNFKLADTTIGTANEQGSGLGLMLCREFSEKQGGFITIQSEIKKGTTVTFALPLS
ncbi:sensor histidine kinase [Mangrovibacterium diazotrophicum]|uniref:sensor histidine kinase n=1 Tax=Mangrovibacterium diazotrophicum TaxID=1261403 RepID=UPI001475F3C3|nr:ATP-binding protein [Mangrovibacterium diazotrophicum]